MLVVEGHLLIGLACSERHIIKSTGMRGRMLWKANLPDDPSIHIPTNAVTLAPNAKFYIGDFLGRLGTLEASAGLATSGWPAPFHDARNTARAGAH